MQRRGSTGCTGHWVWGDTYSGYSICLIHLYMCVPQMDVCTRQPCGVHMFYYTRERNTGCWKGLGLGSGLGLRVCGPRCTGAVGDWSVVGLRVPQSAADTTDRPSGLRVLAFLRRTSPRRLVKFTAVPFNDVGWKCIWPDVPGFRSTPASWAEKSL